MDGVKGIVETRTERKFSIDREYLNVRLEYQ